MFDLLDHKEPLSATSGLEILPTPPHDESGNEEGSSSNLVIGMGWEDILRGGILEGVADQPPEKFEVHRQELVNPN